MTMDDIVARSINLETLLDGIGAGTTVLPDFQRDFDWSESDIVSLIATVLSAWPAGSLLVMRGSPDFFAVREFEFAPKMAPVITNVVLDGQQRLTALHNAFRGAGPVVYAIDARALLHGDEVRIDDIEEAIRVVPRHEWQAEYPPKRQAADALVPLSVITNASEFFEWRDNVVQTLPPESANETLNLFSKAYKEVLGKAGHYAFPTVFLEKDLPPEAVARIFERVNRTGRRLGTFDLLVARSYSRTWNLRDHYELARRDTQYLDDWLGDDGTLVLQAIALKFAKDIRQPALLSLSREVIQSQWEVAVSALDEAIDFLSVSGASNPSWLPYKTLILPLAALAMDYEIEASRSVLEPWFWARSFGQSYDVGSSTKAVSDYRELDDAMNGEGDVTRSQLVLEDLRLATRKQTGALWRAFLSLSLKHRARDLVEGGPVRDHEELVVASLFDKDPGDFASSHLRVMTQVVSKRSTMRGTRTSGLLAAVVERGDKRALKSQFLDPSMLRLDRESFIRARAELVAAAVVEAAGDTLTILD